MKIVYWSDFACPFCYIGVTRLRRVLSETPEFSAAEAEFEMKSFRLDPYANNNFPATTQELFERKYRLSEAEAKEQLGKINEMARGEGLEFHYENSVNINTLDAHRLLKLAQSKAEPALEKELSERLYKAYFTECLNLADRGVLQKLGTECGLDAIEVERVLTSNEFEDKVFFDEREAANLRIRMVPFFKIGEQGFAGAQSEETMREFFRQLLP